MPGTTPSRGLPFPLAGEPPAGHLNIQDLAMAIDAVPKAGIGYCSLNRSFGTLTVAKGSWVMITFNSVSGNHPEWGSTATGLITVPAAGVYTLQFTGACQSGTGIVSFDVSPAAISPGLFLQDSSHHVDTGQPLTVSIANLYQCAAGEQLRASVFVQNHSLATPQVWGSLVVARVEGS